MHERLEKIKTHIQENKTVYIVGASCLAAGAIATVAIMKARGEATVVTDSFKVVDFKWKSPTTNNVTVILTPRGDLGNPVRCLETGELFESQGYAAFMKNLHASDMSKHLNGLREHVGGLHFERLPWAAA